MQVEEWCGYKIRFVEHKGEWWAVLKDICDALDLKTFKVSQRLDPSMMERIAIEDTSDIPFMFPLNAIIVEFCILKVLKFEGL